MKVYGLFAFMLRVFERQRETSRPKVSLVRIGERRRGMGETSDVDVCEGILIIACEVTKYRRGMYDPCEGTLLFWIVE